jgi:hypothetical protein
MRYNALTYEKKMVVMALAGLFSGWLRLPETRLPWQHFLQFRQPEAEQQGRQTDETLLNCLAMRKLCLWMMLACGIVAFGCRTQKTGCPTPVKNLGAERVMDEMGKPPKKGLFRRRH